MCMRVLMTVTSTSLMDGINRHVLAIADALQRFTDVEVGVVTVHPWGDFNNALKKIGVKCWSLGCANGHQLKVFSGFIRVMREFNPDVVHLHVLAYLEAVALRWLFSRVKTVVTVHGIADPVARIPMMTRLKRILGVDCFLRFMSNRPCDAMILVSSGLRPYCKADGIAKYVIRNPMDFEEVERKKSSGETRIIGTACRVYDVKNPLAFTRVMGEVTKRIPNVEAWIVGDGAALDSCKQLSRNRGYDRIKFWGTQNDVMPLIKQMDCFVLTSYREGGPRSLLEAMSVKTPIAFMKGDGGLVDLAEMNETEGPFAVVVDQGNEEVLINGICDLLNDPAKRAVYADKAYEVGSRHFDPKYIAEQLNGVYVACVDRVKGVE